jgi:hypothetical protein
MLNRPPPDGATLVREAGGGMQAVLDAGLPEVRHPGHPYYFLAPGGQVFTIAPAAQAPGPRTNT